MKQQLTAGQLIDHLRQGYYLTRNFVNGEFAQIGLTDGRFVVFNKVETPYSAEELLADLFIYPFLWEVEYPQMKETPEEDASRITD